MLAQDEETGRQALKPVLDIMVRPADDLSEPLFALTIGKATERETVHVTDAHPFWLSKEHLWVEVRDLEVGDTMQGPSGEELVVLAKKRIAQQPTYNLTVDGYETYFVGRLEALVHNCKYKVPKPKVSGKVGAKDVPSWVKGSRPRVGQSGKDFAREMMDAKYGKGGWSDTGARSEFSKIKQWADRAFQDPS
ncbi:MAG TPA: hypothetical protein DIW77_20195 [Chromatiaceae bacterium]|nr:MAG: hypothetical protein N838_18415 [Thiohalocapsa sp. PB-PSB1]HCS92287.1 hypothetical protein [Chromatiaceae bacterium]